MMSVLIAIVIELPIGTNLGLLRVLWALVSGQLLTTRGVLIYLKYMAHEEASVPYKAMGRINSGQVFGTACPLWVRQSTSARVCSDFSPRRPM